MRQADERHFDGRESYLYGDGGETNIGKANLLFAGADIRLPQMPIGNTNRALPRALDGSTPWKDYLVILCNVPLELTTSI